MLLDPRLGAEDGAPHRLAGERGFLEVIENDVVRRIVGLADLLQDHAAFALELAGLEGGMAQNVADDVTAERRVLLQELHVEGGLLARGVGVDMAADRLDFLGDHGGGAACGALEGHVLEEVGGAVFLGQFVAGAAGDIRPERYGLHPVHAFGDDGEARRQSGDADRAGGIAHAVFL